MANEKNIRIGDVLLQAGYINQNELDEALEYQKNNKGIRLGEALIKLGFITEHQQLEALSARLGQRYVKIDRVMVQTEAVAMIPVQLAKKYHMLAVQYKDNNLTIVLNDPLDYYGIEDIRQTTGMNLEIWLTELSPLNQAIEYYYSEIEAKKAASSANEMAREREQALEVDADEGDSDAPVIKLLDNLLARAFSMNASDIHIEPFEEKTSVRIRVDGQLLDYVVLQKSLHQNLIARVKILGQMDIAEKRLPQDGHFRTRIANRDVNIRTSVIPTVFGEKAVLRLLASGNMVADAETFGMNQAHFDDLVHVERRELIRHEIRHQRHAPAVTGHVLRRTFCRRAVPRLILEPLGDMQSVQQLSCFHCCSSSFKAPFQWLPGYFSRG